MTLESAREIGERIVRAVIDRVRPDALVEGAWGEISPLLGGRDVRCDMVAFGKASLGMARAAVARLEIEGGGSCVRGGIVLAPVGCEREAAEAMRGARAGAWERVRIHVVDHPRPTARNVMASTEVEGFVRQGGEDGRGATLLVLISGGGSAHLTLPAEGVSLDEIADVSGRLMRAGAGIAELNTVRKHLERLKGGRLAKLAVGQDGDAGYARVVGVVVSDVVGDDLSVIASGPLTPDPTTFADAVCVMDRRGIERRVAEHVWARLERGARGEIEETPKGGDGAFGRVEQRIIGSNTLAVRAACDALRERGFEAAEERCGVTGEAAERGRELADRAMEIAASQRRGCAIVWGGETTVTVGERGEGVGGRNQEFALAAAQRLAEQGANARIAVMSFATDGVDGPTDAAGAVVTGGTWRAMREMGPDPERALATHDSHGVLDAVGALIRTGPTGTNVNDVMVALVSGDGTRHGEVQR